MVEMSRIELCDEIYENCKILQEYYENCENNKNLKILPGH